MKKVAFFTIIPFLTMMSCISVRFTNIDVQKPAQVTFPKEIVNLAIVNNVPVIPIEKDSDTEILSLDSLSNVLVDSLAYYLDKQGFFGQVVAYPGFTRTDNDAQIIKTLNKEQVQSITQEMNVDGLISIDLFQIRGNNYQYPDQFNYFQQLAIEVYALVRSYTSDGREINDPILISDTLYWEGIPTLQAGKEYALPTLSEICTYLNGYTVEKLIEAYTPSWSTEERAYFANGSPLMNQASKHVDANRWKDAISTWEEAYQTEKNSEKKVRIAYNLAVGYETTDNISKAITWIRAAKNTEQELNHPQIKEQIDWYYKELLKREIQSKIIKEQLGIIDTNKLDTDTDLQTKPE